MSTNKTTQYRDISIWGKAFEKYDNVCFDHKGGKMTGTYRQGCKHLFTIEPYTVMPANWEPENINMYETFTTWNKRFVEEYRSEILNDIKIRILEGGVFTDNIPDTAVPDSFTSYDKKIKGIVTIGRKGHRMYLGNIYFLREEFAREVSKYSYLKTHVYAPTPYGGPSYQGVFDGGPWKKSTVEMVDRYLFYFCPDNTYHPLWSWGYLGENIFRAFKAKTVPIYLGCYNIQEYIPEDLFIDFRRFYRPGIELDKSPDGKVVFNKYCPRFSDTDYRTVAEYLDSFPKERYVEMTEKAFEWQKKRGLTNYNNLISILESLN